MQSKNDIYRFATRNTLLITSSLLPITSNSFPLVAQLDNAADSDSEERGFKSLQAGHKRVTKKAHVFLISVSLILLKYSTCGFEWIQNRFFAVWHL